MGREPSGPSPFIPSWNLHNESRLSIRANALEFDRHAFPLAAIADTETMGSPTLSHNMTYAAAQSMFYLTAGARRIQLFSEMDTTHAGCRARVADLECRISELNNDL